MHTKEYDDNSAHNLTQAAPSHHAFGESIVSRLRDSRKWLELAEDGGFRAANITKQLHLSSRQFRRVVRSVFGSNPENVLTDSRLIQSKNVLQRLRRVKAAAVVLGYKQPSHFSRQFKARYGVSPRVFLTSLGPNSP